MTVLNHGIKIKVLAKKVQHTALGSLKEKLRNNISNLVLLLKNIATTKTRSFCGCVNQDLALSDREWTCPICGTHHNRDKNSAVNDVLYAVETTTTKNLPLDWWEVTLEEWLASARIFGSGPHIRVSHTTMKQEALCLKRREEVTTLQSILI